MSISPRPPGAQRGEDLVVAAEVGGLDLDAVFLLEKGLRHSARRIPASTSSSACRQHVPLRRGRSRARARAQSGGDGKAARRLEQPAPAQRLASPGRDGATRRACRA